AEHFQLAYPHGARLANTHPGPYASWIPVGVDAVPMLEDARQVPLGGAIRLGVARSLDRKNVLGPGRQRLGHFEVVRKKMALRVPDVLSVEPDVALIENPVKGEETSSTGSRAWAFETPAIQERTVRVGEVGVRAPVAGHRDRPPVRVVEIGGGRGTP